METSTVIGAGRINANGTLDTAFGTNGFLPLNTNSNFDVQGLALQPDDKFVVTRAVNGKVSQSTIADTTQMARLTPRSAQTERSSLL